MTKLIANTVTELERLLDTPVPVAKTQPLESTLNYTYESGAFEWAHPDRDVAFRLYEAEMSDCEYGCKIYADPLSSVRVLAHNGAYGCRHGLDMS